MAPCDMSKFVCERPLDSLARLYRVVVAYYVFIASVTVFCYSIFRDEGFTDIQDY